MDVAGQVHHAAGVAHLVVVPGVDLQHGAVGDQRGQRINDGAAGVASVVGTDQRENLVTQNAGQSALGCCGKQLVDLFGRGLAFQLEDTVGERGIQHRCTHSVAVQLAFQLGVDQRDGGGAAGCRRRQAQHRTARAAQVLVRRIDHQIGVGRVVEGGDLAVADADRFMHDLDDGCEAVGGARRGGDDAVRVRVVKIVVDAHDDVQNTAHFHRCSHDDALGATVEVALQGLRGQELAGAFQYQVHAEFAPGNVSCGGVRRKRKRLVRDADGAARGGRDVCLPAALHAVEFKQVRGGCGAALEFVQVDNFQPVRRARVVRRAVRRAERSPKSQAADAAHSVDANSHGVVRSLLREAAPTI